MKFLKSVIVSLFICWSLGVFVSASSINVTSHYTGQGITWSNSVLLIGGADTWLTIIDNTDNDNLLLIQSDNNDGDTNIIDSSNSDYTLNFSNVTHSADDVKNWFGNSSLNFWDSYSYLEVQNSSSDMNFIAGQDFTIDFWVNVEYFKSIDNTYFFNRYVGWNTDFLIFYGKDYWWFRVRYRESNTSVFDLSSNALMNTWTWYHLAFIRYGSDISLYVDGIVKSTGTYNWEINLDENVWLWQRNALDSVWFRWYMDEVRVSNIARWTGNFTPPTVSYNVTIEYPVLISGLNDWTSLSVTGIVYDDINWSWSGYISLLDW